MNEILQRLIKVEILLSNHLKHHEIWIKYFIAPITTGVFLTVIAIALKVFFWS